MADGTALVRIGAPLRPEFAAWRYARQYAPRFVRGEVARWAKLVALTGVNAAMLASGSLLLATRMPPGAIIRLWRRDVEDVIDDGNGMHWPFDPRRVTVTRPDGRSTRLGGAYLRATRLVTVGGTMRLALPDPADPTRRWLEWTGDAVAAIADRLLLPESVTARAASLRRAAWRAEGADGADGAAP